MPKVSGQEIISESTEKSFRALVIISGVAILTKAYGVPFDDMTILGMTMPASIFDVALLVTVLALLYTFFIKWLGDLAAFRLWYSESSIWSQFGTNMKLDKTFIDGGIGLLKAMHEHKEVGGAPQFDALAPETRKKYEEFETNVELYAVRLDAAGQKFATLSLFGHFYVWVQNFLVPVGLALFAIYLLLKFGSITPPMRLW